MTGQARRLARQIQEHYLRYVLGQMAVAAGHPQGRRIDQINVPDHECPECFFGPLVRVSPEQLSVVCHRLLNLIEPAENEIRHYFSDADQPVKNAAADVRRLLTPDSVEEGEPVSGRGDNKMIRTDHCTVARLRLADFPRARKLPSAGQEEI